MQVRIVLLDEQGRPVWCSPWGESRVVVRALTLAKAIPPFNPGYCVTAEIGDPAAG